MTMLCHKKLCIFCLPLFIPIVQARVGRFVQEQENDDDDDDDDNNSDDTNNARTTSLFVSVGIVFLIGYCAHSFYRESVTRYNKALDRAKFLSYNDESPMHVLPPIDGEYRGSFHHDGDGDGDDDGEGDDDDDKPSDEKEKQQEQGNRTRPMTTRKSHYNSHQLVVWLQFHRYASGWNITGTGKNETMGRSFSIQEGHVSPSGNTFWIEKNDTATASLCFSQSITSLVQAQFHSNNVKFQGHRMHKHRKIFHPLTGLQLYRPSSPFLTAAVWKETTATKTGITFDTTKDGKVVIKSIQKDCLFSQTLLQPGMHVWLINNQRAETHDIAVTLIKAAQGIVTILVLVDQPPGGSPQGLVTATTWKDPLEMNMEMGLEIEPYYTSLFVRDVGEMFAHSPLEPGMRVHCVQNRFHLTSLGRVKHMLQMANGLVTIVAEKTH